MNKSSKKSPEFIGVRFLDNIGKVYQEGEFYYRAIYEDKVLYVETLLESEQFKALISENLIPNTTKAEFNIEGYGLVLKSHAYTPNIKAENLTTTTLKQAALNWIKINRILLDDQKGLIDAHFGNYAVDGKANPIWVDTGSIQPISAPLQGFGEFLNTQLNPLFIFSHKKNLNKVNRLIIKNGGLSYKETLSIIGYFHFRYLFVLLLLAFGKGIASLNKKCIWYRKLCLKLLKLIVKTLNVNPAKNYWSKYRETPLPKYNAGAEIELQDPRDKEIIKLVSKINPKTIADVGANNGYFLTLLAKPDQDIIAVEPDERALNKFVNWIKDSAENLNFNAHACVASFYNCPIQADLVLGLAVTHHIALTDQYKFDYIAKRFSEISTKALVVEFMPNGLNPKSKPDDLPDWYSLDLFLVELKKYFKHVQVIEYDRPIHYSPRTLIYCDNKIC